MDVKILDEWAALIGHERAKAVADLLLDKKIDLDFPNLAQGDFTAIEKSIITELEEAGTYTTGLRGKHLNA